MAIRLIVWAYEFELLTDALPQRSSFTVLLAGKLTEMNQWIQVSILVYRVRATAA